MLGKIYKNDSLSETARVEIISGLSRTILCLLHIAQTEKQETAKQVWRPLEPLEVFTCFELILYIYQNGPDVKDYFYFFYFIFTCRIFTTSPDFVAIGVFILSDVCWTSGVRWSLRPVGLFGGRVKIPGPSRLPFWLSASFCWQVYIIKVMTTVDPVQVVGFAGSGGVDLSGATACTRY